MGTVWHLSESRLALSELIEALSESMSLFRFLPFSSQVLPSLAPGIDCQHLPGEFPLLRVGRAALCIYREEG